MENPYDRAHELARSIRASDVYRELKTAKEEVKSNPKFEEMLSAFRKKQQEVQLLHFQGKKPSPEMNDELNKLMTAIQGVPALTKYLRAEERFAVLLNDIQKIIMEPAEELLGGPEKPST